MIDFASVLKNTNAYKTIKKDKEHNSINHAYLVICADSAMLDKYLKTLSMLIMCKNGEVCGKCRSCNLIKENKFADVKFYPKNGKDVRVDDVAEILEDINYKPLEADKKLYVISNAESINVQSQNKLLKTLEEPPKNVHILLGATSEFPLLSTVKSRAKKITIGEFSKQEIFNALKEDCVDVKKLNNAISCSDNTIGKTLALYDDEKLTSLSNFIEDMIVNMQSSKDVLEFSTKYAGLKVDANEFFSVLEIYLRDLLVFYEKKEDIAINSYALEKIKNASGFKTGSIIYALNKIEEAVTRLSYNANQSATVEWFMFSFLEGKYKWQKLSV